MQRFHPVQQDGKHNKGIDYQSYWYPIYNNSFRVVEREQVTLGNGNYVKVKHNGTYSTQYPYVKILVRQGQRVNQGCEEAVKCRLTGPMFVIAFGKMEFSRCFEVKFTNSRKGKIKSDF
jgi:hypothetical protein